MCLCSPDPIFAPKKLIARFCWESGDIPLVFPSELLGIRIVKSIVQRLFET